ncbi:MAG TPA: DUF5700 domain-containing putative Zn-dependent protease [Gemmatimonadaceae bacterium]|nr:DUF5700 domain-containing putative Zn-dependent protease [Gemmatimonadaceae bacterium]
MRRRGRVAAGAALAAALSSGGAACRHRAPALAPGSALQVRMDVREADLALAVADARDDAGRDSAWRLLLATDGYRRLAERESSFRRTIPDSAFLAFLRSDTLRARVPALRATLAEWRRTDVTAAAGRALAYLPPGGTLRATMYLMVKPRTNSFVYDLARDPAIFMYVDPAKSRAQLENTLAHELHHVGLNGACGAAAPADSARPAAVRAAARWSSAFGEGVAMLAAAGGPAVHPHATSPDSDHARWDRDVSNAPDDLRRVERFFTDVLDGRLADADSQRTVGMSFFGATQGPWYTVGWLMARTIETTLGRERLIASLCDGPALLAAYNEAAARRNAAGEQLPLWSPALLERLR